MRVVFPQHSLSRELLCCPAAEEGRKLLICYLTHAGAARERVIGLDEQPIPGFFATLRS
jgi:hypothetical protein